MITIYKNSNGDSRTAPKDVSFKEFQKANDMHITDVKAVMNELAFKLMEAGLNHDNTKKSKEVSFYNDFVSTINNGTDFVSGEWYQHHINKERHHLTSKCPDDVNLLDVLEMIVDCVCAGKARSGVIREMEIDDEILKKSFQNTINLINEITICKE